jgi:hypothetical protein
MLKRALKHMPTNESGRRAKMWAGIAARPRAFAHESHFL